MIALAVRLLVDSPQMGQATVGGGVMTGVGMRLARALARLQKELQEQRVSRLKPRSEGVGTVLEALYGFCHPSRIERLEVKAGEEPPGVEVGRYATYAFAAYHIANARGFQRRAAMPIYALHAIAAIRLTPSSLPSSLLVLEQEFLQLGRSEDQLLALLRRAAKREGFEAEGPAHPFCRPCGEMRRLVVAGRYHLAMWLLVDFLVRLPVLDWTLVGESLMLLQCLTDIWVQPNAISITEATPIPRFAREMGELGPGERGPVYLAEGLAFWYVRPRNSKRLYRIELASEEPITTGLVETATRIALKGRGQLRLLEREAKARLWKPSDLEAAPPPAGEPHWRR